MGPIAELWMKLGLDSSDVKKGADTAKASVGGLGISAKTVFTGVAGGAAAAFGMMTKGSFEMQGAQAAFQKETGRSREEAIAFSKDMNGIVGTANTVGASFDDITSAGGAVAVQFQLTGKANADLTSQFVGFAKVTGQDATGAVNDFDGALDAFGEPAERANGLMDQLVASHQKYGTDAGPAATGALTAMAPALKAMNLGLDDGVGLLNLFEAAGLDAAAAPKALQAAVKELKPGQSLDDLIAQIGSIEDPAKRAQKAMEIFGTKAGTQLANAIQPGMTSLDDYKISAEDAAGATGKAAGDMLTASDKFQMFTDKIGGLFRDAGQTFGPFVSGIAGLGSLIGGALGTAWDTVKDNPAVKGAIERVAKATGPIYKGAMAIAGGIGDAISSGWDAAKSAGKAAIDAAGRVAGAAYGAAVSVGEAIAGGVKSAWNGLADLGKAGIKAIIDGAGKAAGLAYAAAAFVIDRLSSAADAAWGFLEGAASGAAKRAGGVIGKLFGDGFSDNVVATVTGAGGTIIGNLTGNLIQAVTTSWDKVEAWLKKGMTGATIQRIGAASSALYTAGMTLVDGLMGAIGTAWKAVSTRGGAVLEYVKGAALNHGGVYAGAVVVIDKITSALSMMWGSLKARIAGPAAAAGAANAAAYATGAQGEQALQTGLSGMWSKMGQKGSSLLGAVGGVGAIVGATFGLAAVAAAAIAILEHKDELADMFKPLGDAVDAVLPGPEAAEAFRGKLKSFASEIQHSFGGNIQEIRQGLQDAYAKALEAGLSPEDAYAYAKKTGAAIAQGSASSMEDEFAQLLKDHGLPIPAGVAEDAGTELGTPTGTATAEAIAKAFADAHVPDAMAQQLIAGGATIDQAGKLMIDPAKQGLLQFALDVGTQVGAGVPLAIAEKMAAGGGTISNGVAAMIAGISLDPNQAGLADLYEKLNVPQQLAVQWATTGPFDLNKAVHQVFEDTAHTIDPTLAQTVLNAATAAGIIAPSTERYWIDSLHRAAVTAGGEVPPGIIEGAQEHQDELKRLGTDMTGLISDAMNSAPAEESLKDATSELRKIIENELDPDKAGRADALFAIGRKYMVDVQKGLNSEDEDTVAAARSIAIHGINAIEDAGLKGGKGARGLDRIGQLYMQLLQTGMSKEDARTALVAGGIASDTVDKLESWYPEFTDTGEAFSKHVATGIGNESGAPKTAVTTGIKNKLDTIPWEGWGAGAGSSYAAHVASGINTFNWSNKLSHLASVFLGMSPPKTGPIREIVLSAVKVGKAYAENLADGIEMGTSSILRAAAIASDAMGLNPTRADALTAGRTGDRAGGAVSLTIMPGGVSVQVSGIAGDPEATGAAVKDGVLEALQEFISGAHASSDSRWSTEPAGA